MTRKQLIHKAEVAGLSFHFAGKYAVIITRKSRPRAAIALWADGTITRADIEQSVARHLTVTEAAKTLKLT